MIDIHCHILFGLDDGPKSSGDAIAMARQAVQQGIHTVVATPHHLNGRYENAITDICDATSAFNKMLTSHGIPLTVLAGQEVHLISNLLEELDCKKIGSLSDGNYILIELPSSYMPEYYEYVLHEIIVGGMIPIIAHPERNATLLEDNQLVEELLSMGILFQVTAGSLLGKFGAKIQSRSIKWCMEGKVHAIASDAHNCTNRPFDLGDAYRFLESKLGKSFVTRLKANAQAIVTGEVIDVNLLSVKRKFSIKTLFNRTKEGRS